MGSKFRGQGSSQSIKDTFLLHVKLKERLQIQATQVNQDLKLVFESSFETMKKYLIYLSILTMNIIHYILSVILGRL